MEAILLGYGLLTVAGSFGSAYAICGISGDRSHAQSRVSRATELLESLRLLPLVKGALRGAHASRKRAECLRQMPVMLDIVTLGLSAGLSFDSSLELYCQRHDNVLARELSGAMLSWRLGTQSREAALGEIASRLDVASLDRFTAVVSQALAFGSPLASTLERQAQAIRDEQRAQMEEEIERIPVKMLIPLGTLIVPAMLLAILGPLLGSSLAMG